MGYHKVKVTRTRTESAIVEDIELEGTNNETVDDSLADLENDAKRMEKLHAKIKDGDWELDDEAFEYEVDEYGGFDDEEENE